MTRNPHNTSRGNSKKFSQENPAWRRNKFHRGNRNYARGTLKKLLLSSIYTSKPTPYYSRGLHRGELKQRQRSSVSRY